MAAKAKTEGFDIERETRRLEGARERAQSMRISGKLERADKEERRADQRFQAAFIAAVHDAAAKGAVAPNVETGLKRSWQTVLVQTNDADGWITPAYVVKFEGNSPIARMMRADPPLLTQAQLRAAEKVASLHAACVTQPRVCASYDGVTGGGGAGPAEWIDMRSSAWMQLSGGMAALIPVEREVVIEVAVFETSIDALAKRRTLVAMEQAQRRSGAVLQTLSLGLSRLSMFWGLDVANSHGASA